MPSGVKPCREYVVDQKAMDSPIAVVEGMEKHESVRNRRGMYHRRNAPFSHPQMGSD